MDNKIYYYMKLKDDFFSDDRIIAMESMKNGLLYSNILLKLYLKSLKYDGKLMLTEKLPYTADTLAAVLHLDIKEMCAALRLFEEMGFVANVNGVYWMEEIQNYVGKSSTEADRVRDYRKRKEKQMNEVQPTDEQEETDSCTTDENESVNECTTDDVTNVVQMYDKGTPENRDIENIKKDISKDISKESATNVQPSPMAPVSISDTQHGRDKPIRHRYGEYKHVYLTDENLNELYETHGKELTDAAIRVVDEWIERKGVNDSKRNTFLDIQKWGIGAAKKEMGKAPPSPQSNSFNHEMQSGYDMDELEAAVLAN